LKFELGDEIESIFFEDKEVEALIERMYGDGQKLKSVYPRWDWGKRRSYALTRMSSKV